MKVAWHVPSCPDSYTARKTNILLAIRDAFDAARRKLQDYARRERGVVKVHEGSPHGRVSKVFPEEGFGFLETHDGREIYFHEHSVLESGFAGLKVGTEVHFVEEAGEKGSQASTVMPVKHHDDEMNFAKRDLLTLAPMRRLAAMEESARGT